MGDNELKALAARVQRMEDIEEIKLIRHRMARSADDDHNLDTIMPLFADDAVIRYEDPTIQDRFGYHEGKAAIRDYLKDVNPKIMDFSMHYWLQPIIKVNDDGMTATGDWYYWGIYDMASPETGELEGILLGATFLDDYTKENGMWQFKYTKVQLQTITRNHPDGSLWNVVGK